MRKHLTYLLLFAFACSTSTTDEARVERDFYRPWEDLGSLFHDVQMSQVFEDGKTFVDWTPKQSPEVILQRYSLESDRSTFDLKQFVEANFNPPFVPSAGEVDTDRPIEEHLQSHWDYLTRSTRDQPPFTTLIPLKSDYVVPGGRFREVYYWDSYFTMIGLGVSGRVDLIESMLDNFAFLIDAVGFVPNGNRTYYLGRSQPPYFSSMVNLFIQHTSIERGLKYLPAIQKEYDFWMEGAENLTPERPEGKRVVLHKGFILNRYWDNNEDPRPESYREDVELAEKLPMDERPKLYRDLRAAAESGWDFSTRWFAGEEFASIRTTEILPVDLNCLLSAMEIALSVMYEADGNIAKSQHYAKKYDIRKKTINQFFWNPEAGSYQDILWETGAFTGKTTAASMAPLYFKAAKEEYASIQAKTLQKELLANGGVLTTSIASGQQWDAPNGWAPLQWLAVRGLIHYGQTELAEDIKERWLAVNRKVFRRTGKMMEKYNVVDTTLVAGGGEYPTQDGFGWSNGVFLGLQSESPKY